MNPLQAGSDLRELVGRWEARFPAISEEAAGLVNEPRMWSRKQILGHLIDSAANNHQRFIRMQQVEELHFPGYEQDAWVNLNDYAARPWAELVLLWAAYNRHLAHVIERLDPTRLRHVWDTGDARYELGYLVTDYLVHLRHHLDQICGAA